MFKWACLVLFLLFVYHVREVFPPFIMGGIIAYLLNPIVKALCRNIKWLKPPLAIAIIYFGTIGIISIVAIHFGPTLVSEASGLVANRHEMVQSLVQTVSRQLGINVNVPSVTSDILKSAEQGAKPTEFMHFGGLISKSLLAVLVCIVSSIYFILDSTRVGKFFLRFVPHDKKVTVVNLSSAMNVMLTKYVTGQLILIALMSVVAFCFLSLFKLKYALLIAVLSGVLEIIPVLGPFIAITTATSVAIYQLGFGSEALFIPLCFFIARQIEDYLVVPRVIGHAVELHPLAVIFAVLVGETTGGALGMLVAIPVAASIKMIVDSVYPPDPNDAKPEKHGGPIPWLLHSFFKKHGSHGSNEQPGIDNGSTNALTSSVDAICPEALSQPHVLVDDKNQTGKEKISAAAAQHLSVKEPETNGDHDSNVIEEHVVQDHVVKDMSSQDHVSQDSVIKDSVIKDNVVKDNVVKDKVMKLPKEHSSAVKLAKSEE